MSAANVVSVSRSSTHSFSKSAQPSITLVAGLGVDGDAHAGVTVKHRSRVARDPSQPNLRQVHLIHEELLAELQSQGFTVEPGDLGENITTRGIPLLSLPARTRLHIGESAVVEITGLRNPCAQIDRFQTGLLAAVLDKAPDGALIRKTGVMTVVLNGGVVTAGDPIRVVLPDPPHEPLHVV
jgi:MOSC domain-containing protein YiiM